MGKSKKRSRSRSSSSDDSESPRRSSDKRAKPDKKPVDKSRETPEERRARRLAKKQRKMQKKEEEKQLFGYTNEDNPFNDNNLTKAFVWKKKLEREGRTKINKSDLDDKRRELKEEIEKVKQRREARELEKIQEEEMRDQLKRDLDYQANLGWEEKEEQFHKKQAQLRTVMRIKGGREKAIDLLAKNLTFFQSQDIEDASIHQDLDVELTEPSKLFIGLNISDLQDLYKDIKTQLEFGADLEYWRSLRVVCEDYLNARTMSNRGAATSILPAINKEAQALFESKTREELDQLEQDIKRHIMQGSIAGAAVDVSYWEDLSKLLEVHKAKAYLRQFHQSLLQKRLMQLKAQHYLGNDEAAANSDDDIEPELLPRGAGDKAAAAESAAAGEEESFSPVLLRDEDVSQLVVDEAQDQRELEIQRRAVLEQRAFEAKLKKQTEGQGAAAAGAAPPAENLRFANEAYDREARRGVGEDEEVFNSTEEVSTTGQAYWWHDKYRPRKPRYFNRVKTGFEWNKYNSTHYDKENPPPKIVQGYKFNLFYPDLIDPTVPPRFLLEPTDNPDYCILRFSAGPPYEDVAFKIVNKEWEYNPRHGFKCVFDRGVMHLYFNFKRFFYRR